MNHSTPVVFSYFVHFFLITYCDCVFIYSPGLGGDGGGGTSPPDEATSSTTQPIESRARRLLQIIWGNRDVISRNFDNNQRPLCHTLCSVRPTTFAELISLLSLATTPPQAMCPLTRLFSFTHLMAQAQCLYSNKYCRPRSICVFHSRPSHIRLFHNGAHHGWGSGTVYKAGWRRATWRLRQE